MSMKVEIEIPENIAGKDAEMIYYLIKEISTLNCKLKCTIEGSVGSIASFTHKSQKNIIKQALKQ